MTETVVGKIEQLTTSPTPSSSLRSAVDPLVMPCRKCEKYTERLNRIATVVNAALLTTTMRMNSGPEVYISGSRFIEAKSLENVLAHIAELLVA